MKKFFILLVLCIIYTICVFPFSMSIHCDVTFGKSGVQCDCSSRNISCIPNSCPPNTTEFILRNNDLRRLYDGAFSKYAELRNIDVHNCNLSAIDNAAFANLMHLSTINLINNPMSGFKSNIFCDLTTLQVLKISHDLLTTYPNDSWSDFTNLTTLFTSDGPSNGKFSNVITAMTQLEFFGNIANCSLNNLTNNTFEAFEQIPLRTLLLSCTLFYIDVDAFLPLKTLSSLLIGNSFYLNMTNGLRALHVFKDRHMNIIDLTSNFKHGRNNVLTAELISYIGNICVKTLILKHNHLRFIDGSGLQSMKYKNCLVNFDLSENFFEDRTLFFITYLKVFMNLTRIDISLNNGNGHQGISNFDHESVYKKNKTDLQLYVVDSRKSNINNCQFSKGADYVIGVPFSLEFINASFIQTTTHSPNSIHFKGSNSLQLIDFAGTSFLDCSYTMNGLQSLKILNVSNFKCDILNYRFINSCENLEELVMRNSALDVGLKYDTKGVFLKGLKRIQRIDFSDNHFQQTFEELTFLSQVKSLHSLKLAGNLLKNLPLEVHRYHNLSFLDLRNNQISYLRELELDEIETYKKKSELTILLYGNPFVCNCNSLKFVEWLFITSVKVDNNGNYSCVYIDGSLRTTLDVYRKFQELKGHCATKIWLIFSVILFSVMIVLSILGYRYRMHLQYLCMYFGILYPVNHDHNNQHSQYDAYVAYHDDDYKWVVGPLLKYLESMGNFKLVVRHKDFLTGPSISNNIVDAIEKSKKVIVVISNGFLGGQWGEFELDRGIERFKEKSSRIIVIRLEYLKKGEMPNCLLQIWDKLIALDANNSIRNIELLNDKQVFWKCLNKAMRC